MKTLTTALLLALLILGASAMPLLAQTNQFVLENPLGANTLIELIQRIIDGMIRLAVPIAAGLIVWIGMLYMFAQGQPQRIQTATKALTYVVIGFAILLVSAGIISIVQDVLGVQQTCDTGGANTCSAGYVCQANPTPPAGGPNGLCQPDQNKPLNTLQKVIIFFNNLSGWLFAFAIIAGVAMVIISGIAYMFSRGDTERAGRAAKTLLYAIVGIAVAALAWAILNIVANFLTGQPVFSMLNTQVAHAQPTAITPPPIAPMGGPQKLIDIYYIVQDVVGWLFVFGMIAGVGTVIVAGIMFLTAGGNSQRVQLATRMLLYALVGVAIIALAWASVNTIGRFFLGNRLIA